MTAVRVVAACGSASVDQPFEIERPPLRAVDRRRRAAPDEAGRGHVDREFHTERDFGVQDALGIGLADIHLKRPTLEDVFIQLTGKKLRE